jgi:SAM-dependent methyltransferase
VSFTTGTYDDLPFGSRAVRESHPTRLAAVARLFGVDAPAPETARVLELGCAEGGNLLPMALAAPEAAFLGIDLSARQVETGEARRAALGLTNAALLVADVATFDPGPGAFDYVIAHGLYSWVPEPVAEAVLALVGRALSPSGVAFVSYNTYPGWHSRGLVRDLLVRGTTGISSPEERIESARGLLSFAAANTRDRDSGYGEALRSALAHFSRYGSSRLFHEWFEGDNRPVWFLDFAARAARHGLAPLADARLATMPMGRVKPDVDDLLSSRVSGRLEKEELFDVLRNRTFRQTLLVRTPAPGREEPDPTALDGLHFTTEMVPSPGAGPGTSFKGPEGNLSTDDPRLVSALRSLHEALPLALPLAALSSGSTEELRPALLRCVGAGLVEVRAGNVPCSAAAGKAPLASPLARLEAAEGPVVTSLAHRNVELDPPARLLLRELDGRSREEVVESFAASLVREGLVTGPNGRTSSEAASRTVVSGRLGEALESLARRALLVR